MPFYSAIQKLFISHVVQLFLCRRTRIKKSVIGLCCVLLMGQALWAGDWLGWRRSPASGSMWFFTRGTVVEGWCTLNWMG